MKLKKKIDRTEFVLRTFTLVVGIIFIIMMASFFVLSMEGVSSSMWDGVEMMTSAKNITSPLNETVYNKGLIFIGFSMDLLLMTVGLIWIFAGVVGYLMGSSIFYFIHLYTGGISWDEWRKQITKDIKKLSVKRQGNPEIPGQPTDNKIRGKT